MTEHATTLHLQMCLDRLRAGEDAARDELIAFTTERFRQLTRRMLRDFPRVQRWEESGDVFQNASMRLWRSLKEVTPESVPHLLRLAALHIRRELIDLARHHYGAEGGGGHHATPGQLASPPEPSDRQDSSDLASWAEFHQQVDALPEEMREVFDLLWYQELPQQEAAVILGISERTLKRRWQAARLQIHDAMQGEMPR